MIQRRIAAGAILPLLLLTATLAASSPQKRMIALSEEFKTLTARINPAVVQIFVSGYAPIEGGTFSGSGFATRRAGGSGVLVDPSGYIVTNNHVVTGARKIQVRLAIPPKEVPAGRSILRVRGRPIGAQVVGVDEETDLAVLKIERTGLPYLPFGDSDLLQQGQLVLAFGSPRGLDNSVTLGVISAVARQLQQDAPMVYLQTDAPINPGNSGGPLVNTKAELIGINTFIFSQSGGSEGLGFAAPSNIVRHIYEQIRRHGRVRRGVIGVNAQTITPHLAAGLGISREWGVILGDVAPGSPAALAGLKVGDIVLRLNGKVMENGRQFDVNLYRATVGERVRIDLLRGQRKLQQQVQVVERQDGSGRFAEMVSPQKNLIRDLGVLALDMSPEISALLPPPRKLGGVVVAARSTDAIGLNGEFLPGDVILAINGQGIANLKGLRAALEPIALNEAIVVQIQRGIGLSFIALIKE